MYVVVTDHEADTAGATTYWSLSGSASREQLVELLTTNNLGVEPKRVERATFFGRAVKQLGKRRNGLKARLVRSIRPGKYAILEEELDVSADKLRHWDGPAMQLDELGNPEFTNTSAEEAQLVRDAFDEARGQLDTDDISAWLLSILGTIGAVGLRSGGGFYYVPPAGMAAWRKYTEVLKEIAPSNTVYMMPTVKMTADGARAILDGLAGEIEKAAADLTKIVVGGELGVRALTNRAADSASLLAKVSLYEGIVGSRLERLRDVVGQLDVDVAAAKLAAEAVLDEAG